MSKREEIMEGVNGNFENMTKMDKNEVDRHRVFSPSPGTDSINAYF